MVYVFYLDYISKTEGNMHGGNVYSKRVIKLLAESGIKVQLLVPFGYRASDEEEKELFCHNNITLKERMELNHGMKLQDDSILFFPLLRGRNLYLLEEYKRINPTLKIYITVHGLRLLDIKPDIYDKYYLSGARYFFYNIYAPVFYVVKSSIYKKVFRQSISYVDKVFTVSNYSMNQIVENSQPKYIKAFYCGSNLITGSLNHSKKGLYFLFVSAGRPEKNFLRALEAFIRFKKEYGDKTYYLYVTGLNERTVTNLKRHKCWNAEIVHKWVKIWDYIEADELKLMYENSRAVAYISKSEGFGLPAVEACCTGTPIIAPYGSAVPEVLETAAYYIDPYSVDSIFEGMKAMSDDVIYETYRKRIAEYQIIMNKRNMNSDKYFVEEFR